MSKILHFLLLLLSTAKLKAESETNSDVFGLFCNNIVEIFYIPLSETDLLLSLKLSPVFCWDVGLTEFIDAERLDWNHQVKTLGIEKLYCKSINGT